MTVGERIKKARLDRGMTQKQVADICGMADSAIRKYESGRIQPKLDTLRRIATALGIEWTDLADGKTAADITIDHIRRGLNHPQMQDENQPEEDNNVFHVGESFCGGSITVKSVIQHPNDTYSVTFDVNPDEVNPAMIKDLLGFSDKTGISFDGLAELAEIVSKIAIANPKPRSSADAYVTQLSDVPQPPREPKGGTDTPPPDAPETPPEDE